jgi:hypothetical protein
MKTPERRSAPRLKPALGTVCEFDPGPAQGLVWNISASGLSMLVPEAPEVGTILAGELKHEDDRDEVPVLMRVVRTNATPTGDFLVGAAFLRELSEVELNRFADPNG